MFETELQFFIENQEDLLKHYRGSVLVIREREVFGAFPSAIEAYLAAREQLPAGTYMIQPCQPGPAAYTVSISPTAPG